VNSSQKKLNIGVIGAGLSGLVAIKELIARGHNVTCFEATESVGGVFSDPRTYDSVLLTVSNYFMAYSDFMPTSERLRFWTKAEYQAYLERYADHFDLRSRIRFGARVVQLTRQGDGYRVLAAQGGTEQTHLFDAVALCSGQFQKVNLPEIEGAKEFGGEILHSTAYRNAEEFRGKRVLCVGLGESSADVTTEIGEVADKTILSLRRYPLVAQRYFAVLDKDSYNVRYPLDVFTSSRTYNSLPRDIHTRVTQNTFRQFTNSYDPAMRLRGQWNLSAGPESQQVIMKNERIFDAIADGQVEVNVGGIQRLTRGGVVFCDGTIEQIDAVVFCTGFRFEVPFLELQVKDARELYKNMFHPDFGGTLGLIGFVRPQQGGVPALAELQARYFALVCSGERKLPSPEEMAPLAKADHKRWLDEFALTPHVNSLVNYAFFAEDLAREVGCDFHVDPRREPELYRRCTEGPLWAVQYRLRGPGATPKVARQILLEKAPVPYRSSWVLRAAYRAMLWIRRTLPVSPEARPRRV
jgi:cation diffusion facilitator CzcD-associated flavoprotein CzcO